MTRMPHAANENVSKINSPLARMGVISYQIHDPQRVMQEII